MRSNTVITLMIALAILVATACGGEKADSPANTGDKPAKTEEPAVSDKGIGPISHVEIGTGIDEAMALKGKEIFEMKCSACHKTTEERYVGPTVKGLTEKRKPEWIMNMILNPEEMTKKDPVARELLKQYMTQMTFQNVTEEDARAILEYFRKIDNA